MKAYIVSQKDYPEEGAALVFARNGNEARKHGYRYLQWIGDPEWNDVVAADQGWHTAAFAVQERVDISSITEAHVVRHPRGCERCDCIAVIHQDGLCLSCWEDDQ